MWAAISGALGGIWGYIVAGVVSAVIASAGVGYTVYEVEQAQYVKLQLNYADAEAKAIKIATGIQHSQDLINQASAVAAAKDDQRLADQRSSIPERIVEHVPVTVACIPVGLVRVLNGYASGHGTADLSIAPGQPDDACAAVSWRSLAADISDDYVSANKDADQLDALIANITQTDTITQKGTPTQ
jgi:hypothetical protein